MPVILQTTLPETHVAGARLPGTAPCPPDSWITVDEAYAAQMAYRSSLLAEKTADVLYENAGTSSIGNEVLDEVLALLPAKGFLVSDTSVTCPDGRVVTIARDAPLWTLGHIVQEDICVLQKQGDEHVMTSAVLCFPANWRLAEKINRPLTGIHEPVHEYDDNIAKRVQRLFDGVQVGRPLWRYNRLPYVDADLHQPYKRAVTDVMPYIRSERQCVVRMPVSQAVVFTIHSYMVAR